LKERARKELRAMDPDLMADAELRRMAAEYPCLDVSPMPRR
jgi:hypothetical protein